MEQKFNLTISKPFSEKFSQFQQTATGGFCNSCEKEVIDFRQMSDEQVINYLNKKEENICGYFKTPQLNRTMENSNLKQQSKLKFLRIAAVAILSLTSLHSIQAQDKKTKIEIVQDKSLTGLVMDESGPLPGANILLKGTKIGTTTNFNGEFKFPKVLKEGDVILVSFIGYETQKFVIKKDQKYLKVELGSDDIALMGEVEVNQVYKSKR